MKKISNPIVFFGTEDFSAQTLRALIEADYPVVLVITKPDTRRGRGRILTAPIVKEVALAAGIPVIQPSKAVEILPSVQTLDQPVGVLVSYGKIIPQSVIDRFTPGIINVHPSLLPKYRGPSPIESAIVNGDTRTGISIMRLTKDMDAGPVYQQKVIKLEGNETSRELYGSLAQQGATMLRDILPDILSGAISALEQDHQSATYCKLLTKEDGLLRPSEMTAKECERRIRAYSIYPKTKLALFNRSCTIVSAHISPLQDSSLPSILCRDRKFLVIDQLVSPSGKTMTGSDFMRGYAR